MSRGIGGGAEILTENETEIVYKYYNYNLNIPEHRNTEKIMDGRIIINKTEISPEENDIALLVEQGKITINKSRNSWYVFGDYDIISVSLVNKIVKHYEREKVFPDKVSYNI